MRRLFYDDLIRLIKLVFILTLFLLSTNLSLQAATSSDAIGIRVIPNSDYLSPLRWYNENIKVKGSPQALTVDGYEAVRDGRTVYVNAANIRGADFYTNIYIISYNQQAESATIDIFGQILLHWKFNKDFLDAGQCVQPDKYLNGSCLINSDCKTGEYCNSQKAGIIRDTRRLADLADIRFILEEYKKRNSSYPRLSSGSYLANISMSVWPSWKNTLANDLKSTLPIDPLNRLGLCPDPGYDKVTCWNPVTKKFFGADTDSDGQLNLPSCSFVYIYTATTTASYNICAIMESGYITTLAKGACAGSTVSHGATCADTTWTPVPGDVCPNKKFTQTSNCGNTRTLSNGTKQSNNACADVTCKGQKCDTGCGIMIEGTKTDGICGCPLPWGGAIRHGETRTAFEAGSVSFGSNCVRQDRTCTNGTLSGSYPFEFCTNRPAVPCNLPWGGTIADGQKVTAYQAASVPSGSSCVRQDRVCNDGVLSGSYQFESCAFCGDGTKDVGEQCDEGTVRNIPCTPAYGGSSCTYCDSSCRNQSVVAAICGDGTKNGSEQCDDSNTNNLDGCSSNCQFETRIVNCAPMPPNAGTVWNDTSSITQSYSVSGWPALPATIYNNISKGNCHYICAPDFSRDDNTGTCYKCGDGIVTPGREKCEPGQVKVNTPPCQGPAVGTPAYCGVIETDGTQTCLNNCSDWGACVGGAATIVQASNNACSNTSKSIVGTYRCCELIFCRNDGIVGCCGGNGAVASLGALPTGYTPVPTAHNTDECYSASAPRAAECGGYYSTRTSNYDYVDCTLGRNGNDWALGFDHSHSLFKCWY